MPEHFDDNSLKETLENSSPELLTPSNEQDQVTLRVEPTGESLPSPQVSATELVESSPKIEFDYSIKPTDYSRRNIVRMNWNYLYIFLLIPILIVVVNFLWFVITHPR